jgi:hypothetical protein
MRTCRVVARNFGSACYQAFRALINGGVIKSRPLNDAGGWHGVAGKVEKDER